MLDAPHAALSQRPTGKIAVSALSYAFEGRPVLKEIDLELRRGAFVSLLGPSGCGKSTLVRLLAGLLPLQAGHRMIEPAESVASASRIGLCFQEPRLLPWRDCVGNVGLPLEATGTPRAEIQARAKAQLAQVGLQDAMSLLPAQLSGGMKMRVAVARALVTQPSFLLLDEPFAALDAPTRFELQSMLHRLWTTQEMGVLLVTHSLEEAARLSQRALVMASGPGRVHQRLDFSVSPALRQDTHAPAFASALIELQRSMQSAMERSA